MARSGSVLSQTSSGLTAVTNADLALSPIYVSKEFFDEPAPPNRVSPAVVRTLSPPPTLTVGDDEQEVYWYHEEVRSGAPLTPEPAEADRRDRRFRACELAVRNKRWLLCSYVWIRTGKPRPRSVFGIQWCRRLLFLDGIGGLYYVSEHRRGAKVMICNKASIRSLTSHDESTEHEPRPNHVPRRPSFRIRYIKDKRAGCISTICEAENVDEVEAEEQDPELKGREDVHTFWFVTENDEDWQMIHSILEPQSVRLRPRTASMTSKITSTATLIANKARTMVSGNRRRYIDACYNLDLTYITTRIIAMAFPGVDNMGQFSTAIRNDLTEVVKFLQENHAGRYKVFNLCAEKNYSPLHFDGNVEWIPVFDHQPPTLRQIKLFCSSAKRWMLMHPENVVAVHCKGGKGRTGVMISAFLAFEGMALCAVTGKMLRFGTVEDALKLFDKRRTLNPEGPSQGVTGVSQLRYMDLFFHSLKAQFVSRKEIRVTRVLLVTIPKIDREKYFEPAMLIHSCSASQSWIAEAKGSSKTFKQISGCLYANSYVNNKMIGGSEETVEFDFLDSNVELSEDFRIELHDGRPFAKDQAMQERKVSDLAVVFSCFHTSSVMQSPLVFTNRDIDKGFAFKKHKELLHPDFRVEVHFEHCDAQVDVQTRSVFKGRQRAFGDGKSPKSNLYRKSSSYKSPQDGDAATPTTYDGRSIMRTSPLARFSKAAIGRTKSHQIAGDRYKIGKIRTWSTEASLKDITSKNDRDLSDYHLETKSTAQKPISNISVSGDEVMGVGCHGKYLGDEHVPSSFSNVSDMDDITEESLWPSPTPAISHNATSVSLAQRTSFFERLLSPVTKRFDSIKASSPFASPNTLEQHLALKTPKNVGQIGQFLTFNEDIEVEFTQIIMKCKRRRLGAGEISIPAGCTERKFVFVVIGSLRSEILTRHGVSVFNPLLGVHEIVGVVPFILEETPSHADFVTNQVSELCYVDFEEVQRHFDSVNKLSLLFHYLSIELSKNVIHVLGRVKRKKRHDKAKAKMGKFVSLSSFSLEQTDVQASNAGRSFSKRFGSLSISFKDGDRRDSNSKELILKATHLSSRIQIPESEDVITSCNCKISCTSGSVGGLGVLKLTQNYFIFQHKSMLGRSAIIRLDNLTEPGDHSPFPAQALKMKVLLDHTFCVVTRRHPRVNTSRISLEISDSSGRNFVALMRDLLKFQVTANKAAETLRMKVEGESKEAGFSSTTTPRLPLLDLFLSSEGSSTLLVYRPGESVVSRESALRRLCVVWQGAGVGTFHGRVVRRVEFGDLLFLEDFLAQGRATQDHITAALDCQQLVLAAIPFSRIQGILDQNAELRKTFYMLTSSYLALHLRRVIQTPHSLESKRVTSCSTDSEDENSGPSDSEMESAIADPFQSVNSLQTCDFYHSTDATCKSAPPEQLEAHEADRASHTGQEEKFEQRKQKWLSSKGFSLKKQFLTEV